MSVLVRNAEVLAACKLLEPTFAIKRSTRRDPRMGREEVVLEATCILADDDKEQLYHAELVVGHGGLDEAHTTNELLHNAIKFLEARVK